jgi:ABC-type amino acid transport substrate-binding protein|tara:strand:- start:120 stop:443 length:324 start_codon:yes stop_codon:yes gene_type:complete
MPLYDFEDTDTGETFELQMKIAEKADFLKANPNVRQVIGTPMIVGGVDGLRKPDEGFNEVLQKIGEQNPQTPFGRELNKSTTAKQGAVNKAVDKWKRSATYKKHHQK